MMLRRVNSLNDLAERAAMLAPFEDTSASATSSSSSPPSSASSSPVLYSSGLSPLASLASASSAIDLLRATTTQQDMPVPAKPTQPKSAQPGHVREAASGGDKKKRKRETTAAEHLHHAHRHVALRPSLSNSSPGKQTGRDHQAQAHAQPHHQALHMSTGNGHHAGYGKAGANGAAVHVVSSSIPRSTSAPSLAHLPLSPPPPASVAVLSPSSMTSPPPPPPVHSAQISPNSIHLRDFMDNTKHLLTVMCQIREGDAYAKAGAALSDDHQHHQLRLGFGAVVQPVEKASAYWFAEVPSAYEVLRATGLWQRSFLMEVLCQERHLVVDRTLYCGYRRVSQDRFTYFFDSDSETLRQLYAQHSQPAAAAATSTPASTLPFATGGGSSSSGMPFRFSPGTSLPALASPSPSPAPMMSTANGTGTGHHLSTSSPALSTLGRHLAPTPHTASQPLALAANDGRPRAGSPADRISRHYESEAHNGHHHRHHNELGSGGCCVKEEELEEDDDDADDDFYLLKAAYAHTDSAEEGDSFEQPPAKLFLLPEYCYFDPTVLKKRSIRCIPCKVSLSKMGWKQHMLSAEHTTKKAKFNARGQSTQQADELVYRSTRGMLTCLACAVLLPPEDFGKHVAGNVHAKKRKGWALLDHIERWSDILSKKPRYSTATPLSPTLGSSTTSTSVTPLSPTFGATSTSAAAAAGSLGSSGSGVLVDLHDTRSSGSNNSEHQTSTIAAAGSAELAELFHVECYPMTPVTGYTQWVALHSTRNWDARNFEVLITTRGKQDRLVVEPLSWKTTTSRGFLFNLAVKFERTYGPDPVLLCLVIRDTMGAMVQSHEQEIQIPLGRAIVCSNSSQRLKRLQQLGEESALTDTEQRVIPHYTQCALVHKGREHRYRVKPLATVLAAVATVPTSNVPTTPATVPATRAPSPTSSSSTLSSSSGPVAVTSKASPSVSVLSASLPVATTAASMLSSTLSSSSSASALFSPAAATPTTATAPAASSLTTVTPMTSPLHRRLSSLSSSSSSHHHHQAPLTSPSSTSPAPRQPLIVKTSS